MIFNMNFDGFGDIEEYLLEVKVGNQIQRQIMQGMAEMVQMQFLQLMQEAAQSNQPVKVSISRDEEVWVPSKKILKNVPSRIDFLNKAYMSAYPEECKGG